MKVIISQEETVPFHTLKSGDWFIYCNQLYCKKDFIVGSLKYNSIRFSSDSELLGKYQYDHYQVIPVNVTITINKK